MEADHNLSVGREERGEERDKEMRREECCHLLPCTLSPSEIPVSSSQATWDSAVWT